MMNGTTAKYLNGVDLQKAEKELVEGFLDYGANKKKILEKTLTVKAAELAILFRVARAHKVSIVKLDTKGYLKLAGIVREGDVPGKAGSAKSNHRRNLLQLLKALARYLAKQGYSIDLDEVETTQGIETEFTKTDGDVLTEAEVKEAISNAPTVRDRAILALLYDGALRPAEAVRLKWKNVVFDEYGVRLKDFGAKTRYKRKFRLTIAAPYLVAWQSNSPNTDPDAPVFVQHASHGGVYHPITNFAIAWTCKLLREQLKNPKIRPGIFRHSRVTHDIEHGVDPNYILLRTWGNLSSGMLRHYARPSQEWADEQAFKSAGMEVPAKTYRTKANRDLWEPVECPRCKTVNPPATKYCNACGGALSPEEKAQAVADQATVEKKVKKRTRAELEELITYLQGERDKI